MFVPLLLFLEHLLKFKRIFWSLSIHLNESCCLCCSIFKDPLPFRTAYSLYYITPSLSIPFFNFFDFFGFSRSHRFCVFAYIIMQETSHPTPGSSFTHIKAFTISYLFRFFFASVKLSVCHYYQDQRYYRRKHIRHRHRIQHAVKAEV